MHILFIGRCEGFLKWCDQWGVKYSVIDDPARRHFYAGFDGSRIQYRDFLTWNTIDDLVDPLHEIDPLDHIISSQEFGLEPAARISSRFGLRHVDLDVVLNTRDKSRMRKSLERAGLTNVPFAVIRGAEEARAFAASVGLPVIFKPLDLCGSYHVKWAEHEDSIDRALQTASTDGQYSVIAEKYVVGPHYGLITYSQGGRHHTMALLRIFHDPVEGQGTFVSLGQFVNPAEAPRVLQQCQGFISDFLDAIGLSWGPCWTEFRIQDDKVYIIETQNRLPAGHIPRLVEESLGLDMHEIILRDYLGTLGEIAHALNARVHPATGAAVRFFTPRQGRIAEVREAAQLGDSRVLEYQLKLKAGDIMPEIVSEADRQGYVITRGATGEEAFELATDCVRQTRFVYA